MGVIHHGKIGRRKAMGRKRDMKAVDIFPLNTWLEYSSVGDAAKQANTRLESMYAALHSLDEGQYIHDAELSPEVRFF